MGVSGERHQRHTGGQWSRLYLRNQGRTWEWPPRLYLSRGIKDVACRTAHLQSQTHLSLCDKIYIMVNSHERDIFARGIACVPNTCTSLLKPYYKSKTKKHKDEICFAMWYTYFYSQHMTLFNTINTALLSLHGLTTWVFNCIEQTKVN